MTQPILRPAPAPTEGRPAKPKPAERPSAYPQQKRTTRPGWKATLVRIDTFSKLKPVFYDGRLSGSRFLMPPYGRMFRAIVRILYR